MGLNSNAARPGSWLFSHRSLISAVAAGLLGATAGQAQSIPPQYLYALQGAEYQVFSGDVNADGYPDVLAKAKRIIVLIDYDVPIPVPLKPSSPTFVLLSASGDAYTLDTNPSTERINHPAWQPSSHDLVFGDVLGTGSNAMLLRGRTSSLPSFVIVTSSTTGAPVLLQLLSVGSLGLNISGPAHGVSLVDTNHDGRADLVLRTNGLIETVFAADASGLFTAADDDQDRVMMAWRAFCAALDTGDISSAQQLILSSSRARYVTGLGVLGPAITTLTGTWSEPREVSTDATFAEYAITQTIDGSSQVHLVLFRKNSNRWLLEEF